MQEGVTSLMSVMVVGEGAVRGGEGCCRFSVFSGVCFNDFLGSEGGAGQNSPSFFWFPFSTIFYGLFFLGCGSRLVRFLDFDYHVVIVIFPATDDSSS